MELTIFELGCENDELFLKEGRDDKKCVKWGKRLATVTIFKSFLSETSVFKMGSKNDELF